MNKNETLRAECQEALGRSIPSLDKLRNESIFITGGTGFVGTWLLEMLTCLNDDHGFDCKMFVVAKHADSYKNRVPHLAARRDIVLVEKDVGSLGDIPADVSYIVHAAGNPDNKAHSTDPISVMETIAGGTNALLAASFALPNIKKILNVSSGLIYGPQPNNVERISENATGGPSLDSIFSVYAEAKRYAEVLCTAYRNQNKLPITTVRPFTVMGPYQHLDKPWAHVNFIRDGLQGGPIRILGNANTVRSYMYASDMAFWMLRMLCDGKPGVSYNLGSPDGISLKDLALKIAKSFSKEIQLEWDERLGSNEKMLSRFVPDTSLAMNELDLKINVGLDEAIKRTIAWNSK